MAVHQRTSLRIRARGVAVGVRWGWLVVMWLALGACGRVGYDGSVVGEGGGLDGATPDGEVTDAAPTCGAGFESPGFGSRRYRYEVEPVDWDTARTACTRFGPGHALALPRSDEERTALSQRAMMSGMSRWWLGGTDAAEEGVWLDVDGKPIEYLSWGAGEPNNTQNNEHCLDLLADIAEGPDRVHLFDDRACDAAYPYICVCDLP